MAWANPPRHRDQDLVCVLTRARLLTGEPGPGQRASLRRSGHSGHDREPPPSASLNQPCGQPAVARERSASQPLGAYQRSSRRAHYSNASPVGSSNPSPAASSPGSTTSQPSGSNTHPATATSAGSTSGSLPDHSSRHQGAPGSTASFPSARRTASAPRQAFGTPPICDRF